MKFPTEEDLNAALGAAVAHYWKTRAAQLKKGKGDQGNRGAATGGAQMDEIINLLVNVAKGAGITEECIFFKKSLQLPGYFRPTKQWDLVIVKDGALLAAIEAKSHVGSFGNNFNNRTEEAMGSALDLWTAFREGAFQKSAQPFLGYFFMLEDSPKATRPVRTNEPHFPVFPEFRDTSYAKRYELFCKRLVLERHYSASAFVMSNASGGMAGKFSEPAAELTFSAFVKNLIARLSPYATN